MQSSRRNIALFAAGIASAVLTACGSSDDVSGAQHQGGSSPSDGAAGSPALEEAASSAGGSAGDASTGTMPEAAARDAARSSDTSTDTGQRDAGRPSEGGDAQGASDAGNSGGCDRPPLPSALLGWGSVSGDGVTTTTGGAGGDTITVTTFAELKNGASGTDARTMIVQGSIRGDLTIGSNKTIVGVCGASFQGHISLDKSVNVIVRNLKIVGYNCTDNPDDCSGGADAITVEGAAHHLWFDHDDISDGSDGNLDLTHATDFVTVSWSKFHYSGRRTDPAGAAGGHQFSNLIGHDDDNASEDTGHLRITFHHTWWADNVIERMPRVRFGQVHLFNNLYTATGNDYCIGVGNGSSIRSENNVFVDVANPVKDYSSDGSGLIHSSGNEYRNTSGTSADIGSGSVFTPPYAAALDPTAGVEAAVRAGAGPK